MNMRKSIYVYMVLSMLAFVTACVDTDVVEPVEPGSEWLSEMQPSVVFEGQKPQYATRALVDFSTSDSLTANFLRIDEDIDGSVGKGTYDKSWTEVKTGKINWGDAYLLESSSISSPDNYGKRTVYLNPLQTYNTRKTGPENAPVYNYYRTMMVSWYPQTCVLHKNSDGTTASITEFKEYKDIVKADAYSETDDGKFSIRFTGLNGEKDIMVSNAVEAKQWHSQQNGESDYRLPFGSSTDPKYDNPITYKHYMSAVRLHAYSQGSGQSAEIWGKILGVFIVDQPDVCDVELPSALASETSQDSGLYSSAPGSATFSGNVDFPIVRTPMFGADDDRYVVTEDQPSLSGRTDTGKAAYLGYALVKPDNNLRLAVFTEAGIYELNLGETELTQSGLEAGYVYDIYLNFQTVGNISALLLNDGIHKYYDLSSNHTYDIGDTQVEHVETANCYIVHPGLYESDNYDGFAFIANVAGNGDGGILSSFDRKSSSLEPVKAALLWESSPGLVYQVEYMYDYVRFKTEPPVDKLKYKEGNAVIAVYDRSDRVLWSWHIWITDKPADKILTSGGTSVTFLDRNLGATSATSGDGLATYGLYYQWGRKDPSMGPPTADFKPQSTTTSLYYDTYAHELSSAEVYNVVRPTISDGVQHPMYLIMPVELSPYYQYDWLYEQNNNLWGYEPNTGLVQKSIYDPCPAGYRVPAEELNWLVSSSISRSVDDPGVTFNSTLFFPYSGYKGVDRGMSSMTCAWKYVGQKADYMSGKTLPSGHRSRVYMSRASYWNEVGTEGLPSYPYNGGNVYSDGANRRVAGSVRCVKDASLGTIQAAINTDRKIFIKGETIKLNIAASTPSTTNQSLDIESVKLEYSVDGGTNWTTLHNHTDDITTPHAWNKNPEIKVNKASAEDTEGLIGQDVDQKTFITFRITVTNGLGLSVQKTHTVTYYPLSIAITTGDPATDLTKQNVNWYTPYTYTVGLTDVVGDAKSVVIEGKSNSISGTGDHSITISNAYLDNQLNIQFLDNSGNLILERNYSLKYTPIQVGDQHYEAKGGNNGTSGTSGSLAQGQYIVISNKDDVSRHIHIDGSGNSSLSRDSYSAYDVFAIVSWDDKAKQSSYKNVGGAKLMHLATGKYLQINGSTVGLVDNANSATVFNFCSDWGSEAVDNVDIIASGGYYLDSPNYSYLRLSTGGRDHYKWYIQVVENGPDAVQN